MDNNFNDIIILNNDNNIIIKTNSFYFKNGIYLFYLNWIICKMILLLIIIIIIIPRLRAPTPLPTSPDIATPACAVC